MYAKYASWEIDVCIFNWMPEGYLCLHLTCQKSHSKSNLHNSMPVLVLLISIANISIKPWTDARFVELALEMNL